jgi:hypothetical protein
VNNNLWIWTSDWHVVSDDIEIGILGETFPKQAAAVVEHLKGLDAAGMIDTGDCKDHYGASTGDELDNYVTYVRNIASYATVNPGVNATKPILPGNHDEVDDFGAGSTDFSLFDARFWAAPYHWTCDWAAPQIRFIAFHAYIVHTGGLAGFFQMDASERTWLTNELAALPAGWSAIVCAHPAALTAHGNEIHATLGGTELLSLLAANSSKITAYLHGHRHANMTNTLQDGIRHFSGPAMSYTASNAFGGFVILEYLPGTNQIVFHYRYGPTGLYGPFDGAVYSPVTVDNRSVIGSATKRRLPTFYSREKRLTPPSPPLPLPFITGQQKAAEAEFEDVSDSNFKRFVKPRGHRNVERKG